MYKHVTCFCLAFLMAGCAGGSPPEIAAVSSTSALFAGTPDTATPLMSNVVAFLWSERIQNDSITKGRCTGVLISPTRLLTASHCLVPFTNGPLPPARVVLGVKGGGPLPASSVETLSIDTLPTASTLWQSPFPDTSKDSEVNDVAIVTLRPTPSQWKTLLGLQITRPDALKSNGVAPTGPFSGVFSAGYAGVEGLRTIASFDITAASATVWSAPSSSAPFAHFQEGDSGGPLFFVRPDGSRDVIGIISTATYGLDSKNQPDDATFTNLWTNITADPVKSWIAQQVSDPKHAGRWFGEVDYVGPCQSGDRDCDHWLDSHDNCPDLFNPDQMDTDGDGVGDACPCPCDAPTYQDKDGDGVCAVVCPNSGKMVDNCPNTPNPSQSNCNLDAERRQGSAILGDVCDSVPCPATLAREPGVDSTGIYTAGPNGAVTRSWRNVRNQLDTLPLMPFALTNTQEHPAVDTAHPQANVSTYFRFCQSNVALGFDCHAQNSISDAHLTDGELYDPAAPWHRMTLSPAGTGDPAAPTGLSYLWNYDQAPDGQGKQTVAWDYASDWSTWTAVGGAVIPLPGVYPGCADTVTYGPGTCLDGTLWTHSVSLVGSDAAHSQVPSPPPTFPGAMDDLGAHAPFLSNRYIDVRPDRVFRTTTGAKGAVLKRVSWKQRLGYGMVSASLTHSIVLATRVTDGELGILEDSGDLTSMSDSNAGAISSVASIKLHDASLGWASIAEANPDRGGSDRNVVAMAVNEHATEISAILYNDRGTLIDSTTETLSSGGPFPKPGGAAGLAGVPARTGARILYSPVSGGLFIAGGAPIGSAAALHDVWFCEWAAPCRLVADSAYETLLDMVVDSTTNRLWVLEKNATGNIRLAAFDPRGGFEGELTTFAAAPGAQSYYLMLDSAGGPLVVVATGATTRFARFALDATGVASLAQIATVASGISDRPGADVDGYALSLQATDGSWTTTRLQSLPFVATTSDSAFAAPRSLPEVLVEDSRITAVVGATPPPTKKTVGCGGCAVGSPLDLSALSFLLFLLAGRRRG